MNFPYDSTQSDGGRAEMITRAKQAETEAKVYRKAFIMVHDFAGSRGLPMPKTEAEAKKQAARLCQPGDARLIAVDSIRSVYPFEESNSRVSYERTVKNETVSGRVPVPARKGAWVATVGTHGAIRTHETVEAIKALIERAMSEAVVS